MLPRLLALLSPADWTALAARCDFRSATLCALDT